MKTLLIDDIRVLPASHIARTFDEGIAALKDLGPWDALLLDHDLASYDKNGIEKTGYHVILFLEENPHLRPRRVRLVTANSVGLQRMGDGLRAMGYEKLGPRDFELNE